MDQEITHNHHPCCVYDCLSRRSPGIDVIIWNRALPPEKNSFKIFSTLMENGKSFSERFLRQFVCPSINRRSGNGDRMFFVYPSAF